MDTIIGKLEAYIEDLKKRGAKVPSFKHVERPHLKVISAKAGVNYRHLTTPQYRQLVSRAVKELGLENQDISKRGRRYSFENNCKIIESYLKWLKAEGFKLPEDPDHKDEVFFAQVASETGINPAALIIRGGESDEAYSVRLRETISCRISTLGLEVRILPHPLQREIAPLTYKWLLEKGSMARKRELEGKSNARPQFYNTRSALNKFLKTLGLDVLTPIGREFTIEFKSNIKKVIGGIEDVGSRKKFQTEIHRWQDFYQRLVNEQKIPDEFHEALQYLIDTSGLTIQLLSKLIGTSRSTIEAWYQGRKTPASSSLDVLLRVESLFHLPAGTLVNKITGLYPSRRFRLSQLPDFLRQNRYLAYKVRAHLPDDFCKLTLEKQHEVVDSIRTDTLGSDGPYMRRVTELRRLPYRLKEWPDHLDKEFEDLTIFKTGSRAPIGMQRNGLWRPASKQMMLANLSFLFGAICLPANADDVRLRGLGVSHNQLTIALLTCPLLVDWYVRFKCEARNTYTSYAVNLVNNFKAMLRIETGWIRQRPDLAKRLRPISCGATEFVSPQFIKNAHSDWDSICDAALSYYNHLTKEITLIANVGRDPFQRIEGIVAKDDPIEAFKPLIEGMKRDLPNPITQTTSYHLSVRNCVIVALIAVTGLRRNTVTQLDYTGDDKGHLYLQNRKYILSIPRELFKEENSPFFGPKHAQSDYYMELPNVYGLTDIFTEYLNVSRPFLLKTYYPKSKEQPLFVNSSKAKNVRVTPLSISIIYSQATGRYLAENKWRGTGIPGVITHGPHSARHIRGTAAIKKTGSSQVAADANHQSVRMAEKHYARFRPKDRNRRVNDTLFGDK